MEVLMGERVDMVFHNKNDIYITYAGSSKNFGISTSYYYIHFLRVDDLLTISSKGVRENASQVHQLMGMRELMSDPQRETIDLPIRSNLREELSLTEYIIFCYESRKGVVDTVVQTSDTGYLTRRLVEVVQHIVV
ncbi:hypothetical protein HN51_066234 [Arachis hypogaea]